MSAALKEVELAKIKRDIERCAVCKRGKIGKAVPGEGSPNAKIAFIGEAPGKQEAATGRPFVGRSGKLLRSSIESAGLEQAKVFITSAVKYLPRYLTPTKDDIEHGRKHLLSQLAVIKPQILVLMGMVAIRALLGEQDAKNFKISACHGKMVRRGKLKFFLSYHPAAPLHNPKLRAVFLADFAKLKSLIRKIDGHEASK